MQLLRRFPFAAFAAVLLVGCGGNGADVAADRGDDAPLVAAMMPEVPPCTYLDPDTGDPAAFERFVFEDLSIQPGVLRIHDLAAHGLPQLPPRRRGRPLQALRGEPRGHLRRLPPPEAPRRRRRAQCLPPFALILQ